MFNSRTEDDAPAFFCNNDWSPSQKRAFDVLLSELQKPRCSITQGDFPKDFESYDQRFFMRCDTVDIRQIPTICQNGHWKQDIIKMYASLGGAGTTSIRRYRNILKPGNKNIEKLKQCSIWLFEIELYNEKTPCPFFKEEAGTVVILETSLRTIKLCFCWCESGTLEDGSPSSKRPKYTVKATRFSPRTSFIFRIPLPVPQEAKSCLKKRNFVAQQEDISQNKRPKVENTKVFAITIPCPPNPVIGPQFTVVNLQEQWALYQKILDINRKLYLDTLLLSRDLVVSSKPLEIPIFDVTVEDLSFLKEFTTPQLSKELGWTL